MKICFRCNKEIKDREAHFVMVEMSNNKEVRKDYVHKLCWNTFINQFNMAANSLAKSNYLLDAMGNHMKRMEIIKDEVEIC